MKTLLILIVGIPITVALPFLIVPAYSRMMQKIRYPVIDMDEEFEKWGRKYLRALIYLPWLMGAMLICFFIFGRWWMALIAMGAAAWLIAIFWINARKAKPQWRVWHIHEQLKAVSEIKSLTPSHHKENIAKLQALAKRMAEKRVQEPPKEPPDIPIPDNLPPEEKKRQFILKIPEQAEKHRRVWKKLFNVDLNYDAESIPELDKMIQKAKAERWAVLKETSTTTFASYLGETIRHIHGGNWYDNFEHGLHFQIADTDLKIYPFNKIERRFIHNDEESLESFYANLCSLIAKQKAQASPKELWEEPLKSEAVADQENLSPEEKIRQFVLKIPEQAEKHRQILKETFNVDLNYDAESIATLDEVIHKGWAGRPPAMLESTVNGFGSYLGEAVRHIHGGDWCFNEEHGLHFQIAGTDLKIFPFAKVEKRFLNGEEDSLAYYYSFIRSKIEESQKQT